MIASLAKVFRDNRRSLMARYTPLTWHVFVPGSDAPEATQGDLNHLAAHFDAHFREWSGGTGIADYLARTAEEPGHE